jgi:hypothetical protein
MTLHPARAELLDLLDTARPDWTRVAIDRALWEAHHAGATFEQIFRAATRAALTPEARPDTIGRRLAHDHHLDRATPADPATIPDRVAHLREQLHGGPT